MHSEGWESKNNFITMQDVIDQNNKIVLIDSNALIHRSFHALPPLKTKSGILVNAVYGFTSTILKVLGDLKPKYIVAAFDVSKDTFRRKLYPEYKAQRVAAPQELYDQIPLVKNVCEVLNIPIFALEGYEADDVIGTIVNKLKTENEKLKTTTQNLKLEDNDPNKLRSYDLKSYIVTGDKDTYQLIDEDTFVYSIIKGLKNVEIIDRAYVQEKFGFGPELMVDYKALAGDPSDNIPGVPGIGEKTATKLIQEFGSIKNLYKKLEASILKQVSSIDSKSKILDTQYQILNSKKLVKTLIDNKNQAFLSYMLATIKVDVPLKFNLADCRVTDYNKARALKLFNELEFKSLISRLPEEKRGGEQAKLF